MKLFLSSILILLTLSCSDNLDGNLERVIKHYDLRPLAVRSFEEDPKYILGQKLFFDNILSGNRDVSCATCHLWKRGSSDALPQSIGTNAFGLGEQRKLLTGQKEHPRNSLDLWNRDNNDVRALFWDGRVEMIDPERRIFRTPMEDYLPAGLDNTLAVQALFPLVRPDEMLGRFGETSSSNLPKEHSNKINELVLKEKFISEKERIESAFNLIMERLLGKKFKTYWQKEYLLLFRSAYPKVQNDSFSIVHVANALAHFEELAFATRKTNWDDYLDGDKYALNASSKRGALLFYGKGRCVSCHSGNLMSDFNYHNLGIPENGPGFNGNGEDLGRYYVTLEEKDKYKFRTPPLRNVSKTYPYFHNGIFSELESVIKHHTKISYFTDKYKEDGGFMLNKFQSTNLSPILVEGLDLNENDIKDLLSFLDSLSSSTDPKMLGKIIPQNVPSNIKIHSIND